jgi:hypothetical protein
MIEYFNFVRITLTSDERTKPTTEGQTAYVAQILGFTCPTDNSSPARLLYPGFGEILGSSFHGLHEIMDKHKDESPTRAGQRLCAHGATG